MKVIYFLEDKAHEGFIKSVVEKIALLENPTNIVESRILSGRKGSKILKDFHAFMRDIEKTNNTSFDFIVITVDGNCKGSIEKIRELQRRIRQTNPYKDKVVYAVPDPHIEKWYIMDQHAFKHALNLNNPPALPAYKCARGYYKDVINRSIADAGFFSYLGAAEYAEDIINNINDIYGLGRMYTDFGAFVDSLRRMIRLVNAVR